MPVLILPACASSLCPAAVKGVPKQQPGLNPFHMQEMESNCKVCELNRLTFEPPSLYCFGCGQRIKRNQVRGVRA